MIYNKIFTEYLSCSIHLWFSSLYLSRYQLNNQLWQRRGGAIVNVCLICVNVDLECLRHTLCLPKDDQLHGRLMEKRTKCMDKTFVIWQNCFLTTRRFTMMWTCFYFTSSANVMIEDVTWLAIFPR